MSTVSSEAEPPPVRGTELHSPDRSMKVPAPPRPATTLTAAGDLLRALAAPVRIAIVLQLRESPRCVHELVDALGEAGALGRFLLAAIERMMELMNSLSSPGRALGETYILGDSPLVTLTALQSSFEPDSASSGYVVRPTPKLDKEGRYVADPAGRPMRIYTSIDTRLTFEDMFRKFRKHGKR